MCAQLKLAIILAVTFAIPTAKACTFINVAINPQTPEITNSYVGGNESIEIKFNNEITEGNIEVFPDSALAVSHKKQNLACLIEGGVWVRKDVYVSDDNMTILAHEFSGSYDALNFYDASNCKKIGEIDISDATWKLDGANLYVSRYQTASRQKSTRTRIFPLANYCKKLDQRH